MYQILVTFISVYPTISFFCLLCLVSLMGQLVVTQYLTEKQVRSSLSKLVFTITFTSSVGLLTMFFYEIWRLQLSQTLWTLMLLIQVVMCLIVLPICMIFAIPFLSRQMSFIGKRVPLPRQWPGVIAASCYGWVLIQHCQDSLVRKGLSHQGLLSRASLTCLLELLVNKGVYVTVLMSAYGAVWCPYIYFNHHFDGLRMELLEAKAKTKHQIRFIIDQIRKNKCQLMNKQINHQQLTRRVQIEMKARQSTGLGWLRGVTRHIGLWKSRSEQELEAVNSRMVFLKEQLKTLQTVHIDNFNVYKEIVDEERRNEVSQTAMGKMFRMFSVILVAYSISRFLLTAWNILKGRELSTDPITRLLNFLTYFYGADLNNNLKFSSQYISFGFMGYLMISSVRSFSMNMKNLLGFLLRRRRMGFLETDTVVLLIAELYGLYFLAAVILLQTGLPRTYVQGQFGVYA